MYKVGIDAVSICRIEKSIKNPKFLETVFTAGEIEYCHSAENFAGIFAAKEAYFKACGTGIKMPMNQVEIKHDELGRPLLNRVNSSVSITHESGLAIAFVIIWE